MGKREGSDSAAVSSSGGSSSIGSNRIVALDVDGMSPSNDTAGHSNEDHLDVQQLKTIQKPRWKTFLSFVGPGILVSMAYIDPGSLETDLQAGSSHGFELLWVLLIGMIFALIIQYLAANLGVSTGKHLAELCRAEYPKYVKYCLWILAEIAVIAADIPEVIGTAFAINILIRQIPVWVGVLGAGLSTLFLLGVQRYGVRKLELLVAILILIIAGCFFGELSYVKPPVKAVIEGMFVPKLSGQSATSDAIAIWGALIMPHNLFLHSALVLSRKIPNTVQGINDACRYFLIENGLALFVAFMINVAMILVPGTVCNAPNISQDTANRCSSITLDSASFLLQNVLGKSSSTIYAIALLSSGQSSAITGTYAGQFIMHGFLNLKMKTWKRNLITRCIAIVPSLIVSIIGGPQGGGRLIIIASMLLSFELPFSMIPLLKFSSSSTKMGPHRNSIYIIIIGWILGLGIMGINVYFLSTSFVAWLIHNSLPKVGNIFVGIIIFPLMAIYVLSIIYLTFRKDTVVTYVEPDVQDVVTQMQMEKGTTGSSGHHEDDLLPAVRQDLVDITLPE